jgi:hypothetical protein
MLLDASSKLVDGIPSYRHLIPIWARGKIERDLAVDRSAATLTTDTVSTISAVFRWMEAAAAQMLRTGVEPAVLLDDIGTSTLSELAGRHPALAGHAPCRRDRTSKRKLLSRGGRECACFGRAREATVACVR